MDTIGRIVWFTGFIGFRVYRVLGIRVSGFRVWGIRLGFRVLGIGV